MRIEALKTEEDIPKVSYLKNKSEETIMFSALVVAKDERAINTYKLTKLSNSIIIIRTYV